MANINVTATIAKIEQIATTHNIELPSTFQKIKARANDPVLYVGLIGEFSSGKSTLVNAWMGDNLLKTDILQATTAAPTVVQAESTYQIGTVLNNGDKILSEKFNQENVFKDKLLDFLHKASAQEEYSKNIKLVSLSYPNAVLREKGFALIDTPGANAENERHKEISGWAVEELCDVAIVIIPANIPYSSSLDEFIKTYLKNSFQKCVFIMTKVDSVRRESELNNLVSTVQKRIESSLGIKAPEILTFAPQLYLDTKSGEEEIAESKQHFVGEFEENTKKLFKLLYEKRDEYFYLQLSDILKSLTETLQNDLHTRKEEYRERIEYINANTLPDLDGWLQKNSQECQETIYQNLSKKIIEAKLIEEKNLFITTLTDKINALESKEEIKAFVTAGNIQQKINANANKIGKVVNDYLQEITTSAFEKFNEKFTEVYKNLAVVAIESDSTYHFSYSHRETSSSMTAVENAVAYIFQSEENASSIGHTVGSIIGGTLGFVFALSQGAPGGYAVEGAKEGAEIFESFFSMFVTKGGMKKKAIAKFTEIIETNYFPQIIYSTEKKLDQFLSSATESVKELKAKYKQSYRQLIDGINKRNEEEKKSLEIYSVKAESNISDLVGFKKELEASDRIAIVSDAKHSYLDKVPQFMKKDFVGNSNSTLEIANLLGSSAKLTRYVDVMLLEAFSKNDSDGIVRALELDANPNLNYANGETLLIWAIRNNNSDICKILLEYGAKSQTSDKNGNPAIFIATEQKSIEIIQLLLKYGADVNATTPDQKTPLMAAVIAGESKIVDFLLAHDANPKAKDKNKLTAFKYAKQGQNQNIIDSLKEFESHKGLIFAIIAIILIIAGAAYYFLKMS